MAKQILPPSLLRELFECDAKRGTLKWKVSPSSAVKAGDDACGINSNGYATVVIFTGRYFAHRIIWAIVKGVHPVGDLDHINGDRLDNKFSNLRDVDRQTNNENRREANENKVSCKLLGATYDRASDSWKAQISSKGKNFHLGRYPTAESAHAAYVDAKRRLHSGCTV